MIGNFFAAVFDAIAGIGQGILSIFTSVADAVVGLAIMPFASMFGAIFNWAINGICELMELVGVGTIDLLRLDIGSGASMFEIVTTGIGWLFPYMRLAGLGLVSMIFLVSLLKILVSPDDKGETPGRLVATTIIAAFFVTVSPTIIMQFERLFNVFLGAILDLFGAQNLCFKSFAKAAQLFVQGGSVEVSLGAQMTSLVTVFVYFRLILMIAWNFIKYFMEVIERYVLMGVLFFTAPLGAAFYTSKSTRESFSCWVRMIGSNMLLLTMNAFFVGVFFKALGSFEATMETLQSSAATSGFAALAVVILWGFLMIAILVTAGKLDSYMQTLGVSAAEAGRSAMGTMLSNLFAMGAIGNGRGRRERAHRAAQRRERAAGERAPNPLDNAPGREINTQKMSRREARKEAKKATTLDRSGCVTARSLSKLVALSTKGADSGGLAHGQGVLKNVRGMPSKLVDKLDPKTCSIENGAITMQSRPDANGNVTTVTMVPTAYSKAAGGKQALGGRIVTLDGHEYRAVATGAEALAFNAYTPGAKSALSQANPDMKISQVKVDGEPTGVYRATVDNDDGTRTVYEWAPASAYQADAALDPKIVSVNGSDFYAYAVTFGKREDGTGTGHTAYCDMPVPPAGQDRADWLAQNFPQAHDSGYQVKGAGQGGTVTLEKNGDTYTMAPAAMYSVVQKDTTVEVETIIASNGTHYVAVKGDESNLKKRDWTSGPFGEEIKFTPGSGVNFDSNMSEILKTAYNRWKGGKRD